MFLMCVEQILLKNLSCGLILNSYVARGTHSEGDLFAARFAHVTSRHSVE